MFPNTQTNAIDSLVITLGNDHKDAILKGRFAQLMKALELTERTDDYWQELLSFCEIDDPTATVIPVADLRNLYQAPEYNHHPTRTALTDKLKATFRNLDADGDGFIDCSEIERNFSQTLNNGQINHETLQQIVAYADLDGDGKIDLTEFIACVLKIDPNDLARIKPHLVDRSVETRRIGDIPKIFIPGKIDKAGLQRSMRRLMQDETFAERWLIKLFDSYPETRVLFGKDISVHVEPVMDILSEIIDTLDSLEEILPKLQRLGAKHTRMGIKLEYFQGYLNALIETLSEQPGGDFTHAEKQMWVDLFALIYHAMMSTSDISGPGGSNIPNFHGITEDIPEHSMLDPAKSTPEEFIDYLREFALGHQAVSHSYLTRIADGDFPDVRLAIMRFFDEYVHYSGHFREILDLVSKKIKDKIRNQEHLDALKENLDSERAGKLDEDAYSVLSEHGITRKSVAGISHKKLFARMHEAVISRHESGDSRNEMPESAGMAFANDTLSILDQSSPGGCAAGMGLAIEGIVPTIYQYFLSAIQNHTMLTAHEYAFLVLHIYVDDDHSDTFSAIAAHLADTREARGEMLKTVEALLDARVRLWDRLLSTALVPSHIESQAPPDQPSTTTPDLASPATDLPMDGDPESLYDAESQRWARNKPTCLSDFTARPWVFAMCEPHITPNTRLLDIGCGEGYCTRVLHDLGAQKPVGVDISEQMIHIAKSIESRNKQGITYIHGNACQVHSLLANHFLEIGLTDKQLIDAHFDLVTAVFLFNYQTIEEMYDVGHQVYTLLRPGGRFVFTVPHPSLRYWDRQEEPPFFLRKEGSRGYFADRDTRIPGVIYTRDGVPLDIQSVHKNIQDYIAFIVEAGFIVEEIRELGVTDSLIDEDPTFFEPLQGIPLHLAIKVIKPGDSVSQWLERREVGGKRDNRKQIGIEKWNLANQGALLGNAGALQNPAYGFQLPPEEVLWNCADNEDDFVLRMPDSVVSELVESAKSCLEQGIDHTNYEPGDVFPLTRTKRFAQEIAIRLMRQHGSLVIQGLDIDALAETEQERERMAKLCYYILATSTGKVDTTRGRLFDVKDHGLDANHDNVLFSVTSQECGWHTDGSSRDWFPDIVCLLCIHPAKEGGEFQIANACNAYHHLRSRIPDFLMYELTRPLVRDIIEKGATSGFGQEIVEDNPGNFWTLLAREPEILRERLRMNRYPIFERNEKTRQCTFRFLDHWLYSGHRKAGLRISPFLKMAVAELNRAMYGECRFNRRLDRGEIVMANNYLIDHRRNEFRDPPDMPIHERRLLVRCWLQIG
uniref:Globin n=1 Tax=Candidatus Kentrum sp. TUN TaxID=2126343 RepID=A0A450ZTE6_9GAMM|nr:MAG: Globin [Candidatus Kentron sp. TUN]